MSSAGGRRDLLDPVAAAVESTLFRPLAVLRVLLASYVVILNGLRWQELDRPVAGWTVVAVVVAWTAVACYAYASPSRRSLGLLCADFAVAAGALLATPAIHSAVMEQRTAPTIPSFWVMTPVLAWAVTKGWRGGLAAAVVMSVLDLSVRENANGTTAGNIFLLLLAAGIVGYSSTLLREASEARAEAERVTAVLSERARLARAVHDGVLQVLALVQRRGAELGGGGADLARLAGDQEVALRALVQGSAVSPAAAARAGGEGRSDLMAALAPLASATVTLSGPASEVLLPEPVVHELRSVVRACLDNVERHVAPDAHAWVLVEQEADTVAVSVRDEGPGIRPGRLEQAAQQGRMGVSESILGRMRDLGGDAALVTAPGQGTEWELRVPVSPRPAARSPRVEPAPPGTGPTRGNSRRRRP